MSSILTFAPQSLCAAIGNIVNLWISLEPCTGEERTRQEALDITHKGCFSMQASFAVIWPKRKGVSCRLFSTSLSDHHSCSSPSWPPMSVFGMLTRAQVTVLWVSDTMTFCFDVKTQEMRRLSSLKLECSHFWGKCWWLQALLYQTHVSDPEL